MSKQDTQKPGFFARITNYFRGVRSELKKVNWPSRKQVMNYTAVVIVMALLMAAFFGLLDILFNQVFYVWL